MLTRYKGASRGSARKGLAIGSILHFRCDEGAGNMIDSVNGVTIPIDGIEALWGISNNAITFPLGENQIVNQFTDESGSMDKIITSGVIVIYSCAKYYARGADVDDYDYDQGVRIFQPFHTLPTTENSLLFQHEAKLSPSALYTQVGRGVDVADLFTSLDLARSSRVEESDSRHPVGKLYSWCAAIKIGVNHTPKLLLADGQSMPWDTTDFSGDKVQPSNTTLISSVDLSLSSYAMGKCDGYVMGALHLDAMPTNADLIECADWHRKQSPKGQKDVWNGWNKYSAA